MDSPVPSSSGSSRPERLAVISCAALGVEIELFAKLHPHVLSVEVLDMNLHERPSLLREVLQKKIDELVAARQPDAVALVYGLCGCGLAGVRARNCPVVVPRAHDCVTLFLGDKERYAQLTKEQPETYWYTPGWNQTGRAPSPEKMEKMRQEFAEKFDPEDADYLIEQEMEALKIYKTAAYIDFGIDDSTANEDFAKKCAEWMGWKFQRQTGNRQLLMDLLAGNWDAERFLVVPPGHEIQPSVDERVMKAVPSV